MMKGMVTVLLNPPVCLLLINIISITCIKKKKRGKKERVLSHRLNSKDRELFVLFVSFDGNMIIRLNLAISLEKKIY